MRVYFISSVFAGLLATFFVTVSSAADGSIIGLSADVDHLELFESPKEQVPAKVLSAAQITFPAAILAESNNGMYQIRHKGAAYWVISDDVESNVARKVDTACDPKMVGSVVAHGKRGASEGCK
jgi:hypothetical protein